jgi:outer membrane immunogenic protein
MKTPTLAISIVTLAFSAASAADMEVKSIAPPAVPSWAGFYIGGHGGYGWNDDPFTFVQSNPPSVLNGFKSKGWIGGGHVGYNSQYGAMVGGLELDLSATGIKGNSATAVAFDPANGVTTTNSLGHDVKLLGSARGRLGWTPNADWLVYGTGGLAWEHMEQSAVFTSTQPAFSTSNTSVDSFGWVLGTGLEARLAATNWIARVEYLHYGFGHTRSTSTLVTTIGAVTTTSTNTAGSQTIDIVRAGLSYKFGN